MDAEGEVWRVYLPEWLIMYTSDAEGNDGYQECWNLIKNRYERSLPKPAENYFRIVQADSHHKRRAHTTPDYKGHYCVQLLLPNLRAEARDRTGADLIATELGPEAEVVARDSIGDKALQRRLQL
jgi:hypothetical protein